MALTFKQTGINPNPGGGYTVNVEIHGGPVPLFLAIESSAKDSNSAANDVQEQLYRFGADIAATFDDPLGKLV